jgi:hypothetical protein
MQVSRIHISSFVGLTILAWISTLWIQGIITPNLAIVKPFSLVVSIVFGVAYLFDRYMWSWKIFQGWYVKRPDIRGTWKVYIQSDWADPKNDQTINEIEAYLCVKQTWTSLHMRLMTKESCSRLITHCIILEDDGTYKLTCVYRNEPKLELRGVRSEIHYGAFSLEIDEGNIVGNYWTDRKTIGSMIFEKAGSKLFHSFDSAKSNYSFKT